MGSVNVGGESMAQQQNPLLVGFITGLALLLIGGALLNSSITFPAGVVAIICGIVVMVFSVLGFIRRVESM